MKNRLLLISFALCSLLLLSAFTSPDEGEWLLTQIGKLRLEEMRSAGLQLSPDEIYASNATSLTSAIVLLGGGTASFVSNDGLLITNHHVAYGAIQSHSSTDADLLANGFLAGARQDELSVPGYTAQIVTNIEDVTKDVLSAVNDNMPAEERAKAIQKKIGEIQAAAKAKDADKEFRISEMYSGLQYHMFTFEVLRDVRLVYAPPSSIGNYGGEVDNWMWPRHTGDFSLMRAYTGPDGKPAKYAKENVPYHPKKFLPISTQPLPEGSFTMILGFPGRTYRYRTSPEVKLAKEETLPMVVDWFTKRINIINAAGKNNRAVDIQYASKVRGVENTMKNYVGTLEGMRRSNLLKVRQQDEAEFMKFLATRKDLEGQYKDVLKNIATAYEDLKGFNKKQFYLGQLMSAIDLIRLASQFQEYAESFKEDSTGQVKPTSKTNLPEAVKTTYKDMTVDVDKEQLVALILTIADMSASPVFASKESAVASGPTQEIKVVREIVGSRTGADREKEVREFVNELYGDSRLSTAEGATALAGKDADDIKDDPLVRFAAKIAAENTELQPRATKFNAEIGRLRSQWIAARMAWKGDAMYPDANRTIRFTYGTVKRYDPRDAVQYDYMTSLGGIMEKETGEDPFIVPAKLRQLWEAKDFGRYTDPHFKNDVPVAFIANLDITGGNSGSPVINGKGELVGVAFDGNWEAVVGDYYFQDHLNRTISVDSRYVLFILDKFSNAQNILQELEIH